VWLFLAKAVSKLACEQGKILTKTNSRCRSNNFLLPHLRLAATKLQHQHNLSNKPIVVARLAVHNHQTTAVANYKIRKDN